MPSAAPTACAAPALSPLISSVCTPRRFSSAIAAAAPALGASPNASIASACARPSLCSSASHDTVRPWLRSVLAALRCALRSACSSRISRSLPRRSTRPSTMPPMPRPAIACTSLAVRGAPAAAGRASSTARASGCSLPACNAAASSSSEDCVSPAIACSATSRGPALGERAGLVERDRAHRVRQLQRLRVLDQDAVARRHAGAHHDRGGRGQAECARAGDHQHRHRVEQRRASTDPRASPRPAA